MSSFGFSTTATHVPKTASRGTDATLVRCVYYFILPRFPMSPPFAAQLHQIIPYTILFCKSLFYCLHFFNNYPQSGLPKTAFAGIRFEAAVQPLCLHKLGRGWVSLQLGHARVLTPHCGVIHCARAASLPRRPELRSNQIMRL